MRTALFVAAAAIITTVVWLSWPAPPHDCGNILAAPSVHECGTTKGFSK
jgi:hypothetical protein